MWDMKEGAGQYYITGISTSGSPDQKAKRLTGVDLLRRKIGLRSYKVYTVCDISEFGYSNQWCV